MLDPDFNPNPQNHPRDPKYAPSDNQMNHIYRTLQKDSKNNIQKFLKKEAALVFESLKYIIDTYSTDILKKHQKYQVDDIIQKLIDISEKVSKNDLEIADLESIKDDVNEVKDNLSNVKSNLTQATSSIYDSDSVLKAPNLKKSNIFEIQKKEEISISKGRKIWFHYEQHKGILITIFLFLSFIAFCFYKSEDNSIRSEKMQAMTNIAFTPINMTEMMQNEFFTKKTFRDYIILMEKRNKEQPKELQWDIRFNDSQRFAFMSIGLNKEQCKTMVALKEVAFDISTMKVNGINLPNNYWTGSDASNWEQPLNQNLCSLNNNKIDIALSSIAVKSHIQAEKNYNQKNWNFLKGQHQIALSRDNSPILNEALKKEITRIETKIIPTKNKG